MTRRRTFWPLPFAPRGAGGRSGFLLLEAILGISIFALFLTAVGLVLLLGQESTADSGDRVRGAALAEEALDAARAIRDGGFGSLTPGLHGVELNGQQKWVFVGTNSTRSGAYILTLSGSALSSDWVRITAETKWKHGYNRSGSVLLTTELTNWQAPKFAGDWSTLDPSPWTFTDPTGYFNAAAIAGNYLYVTGDASFGGAGLYIFDISAATPSRVLSSFTLGTTGSGVAVKGRTLYVVTGDASQEVRAYDLTPVPASAPTLLTSYNLSGSSLARTLHLDGDKLLIGTKLNASFKELYTFNVRNTGAIVPLSNLEISADVTGIVRSGTSAYLSLFTAGAPEMKEVAFGSAGELSTLSYGDINLADRVGAITIARTGTATFLGSARGAYQELALYMPGTFYHEGSGSVVGVTSDPANCYGFIAARSGRKAFQVFNLKTSGLPELTTYTSTNGTARGVLYDPIRDRLFLLLRTAVMMFAPGAATGPCS